jgi:hypothetical protein
MRLDGGSPKPRLSAAVFARIELSSDASRRIQVNEIKNVAKSFLIERTNALCKDVIHCLNPPFAPIPAIVYCFSTIDLFGALSEGNASRSASTAYQAINT